eukprot:GHVH01005747.1.p1 GENE.GHVH01005747.1~~GHVH01005747.1.p1  ORF type:complete len:840 (+),score=163.30 GHVH01005747.1:1258-3777(+)
MGGYPLPPVLQRPGRLGKFIKFFNVDVIIGTRGRLDSVIGPILNPKKLKIIVVDEFDAHMDDENNRYLIKSLIMNTVFNTDRQMIYLSATMVQGVILANQDFNLRISDCLRLPKAALFEVKLDRQTAMLKEIGKIEHYLSTYKTYSSKFELLFCVIQDELERHGHMSKRHPGLFAPLPKIIVFCGSRKETQSVYNNLMNGFDTMIDDEISYSVINDDLVNAGRSGGDGVSLSTDQKFSTNPFNWRVCNNFLAGECDRLNKCRYWHGDTHVPFLFGCSEKDTLEPGKDEGLICFKYVRGYTSNPAFEATGRCNDASCTMHHPTPYVKPISDTETSSRRMWEDVSMYKRKRSRNSWVDTNFRDNVYRHMGEGLNANPDAIAVDNNSSVMSLDERQRNIEQMKKHGGIMACTDVLQRGVQFDNVNLVVQWTMPPGNDGSDIYIHRAGRTGRKGDILPGRVVSLYSFHDSSSDEQAWNYISAMVNIGNFKSLYSFWNDPSWRFWMIKNVFIPKMTERDEAILPEMTKAVALEEAEDKFYLTNSVDVVPTREQLHELLPQDKRDLPDFDELGTEENFEAVITAVFGREHMEGTSLRQQVDGVAKKLQKEINDGATDEDAMSRFRRLKKEDLDSLLQIQQNVGEATAEKCDTDTLEATDSNIDDPWGGNHKTKSPAVFKSDSDDDTWTKVPMKQTQKKKSPAVFKSESDDDTWTKVPMKQTQKKSPAVFNSESDDATWTKVPEKQTQKKKSPAVFKSESDDDTWTKVPDKQTQKKSPAVLKSESDDDTWTKVPDKQKKSPAVFKSESDDDTWTKVPDKQTQKKSPAVLESEPASAVASASSDEAW